MSIVGYCRVSTDKQADGHSLSGQRSVIGEWAKQNDLTVQSIHSEVASGANLSRPVLEEAIEECRTTGARLVVVKLDRLARDVGYICEILKMPRLKVEVIELGGNADPLVVHIFASIAEHQRRYISLRTKEGLREAKRKGVKLGNPNWAGAIKAANEKKSENANQFALGLKPVLNALEHMGHQTLAAKAQMLNQLGHRSRRGFKFQPTTVRNVELRIQEMGC